MLNRKILSFMCDNEEADEYHGWIDEISPVDGFLGYHHVYGISVTTFYFGFINSESMDAFEMAFKLRWL